jgi:hypothetical protein
MPLFGQSGRAGWDGTWVGGWDRGEGVQIIFAGETLIGFYFRNDSKKLPARPLRSMVAEHSSGAREKATLTHSPGGGTVLNRL